YSSMSATLPAITQLLITFGTTARKYILWIFLGVVASVITFRWWAQRESSREFLDRTKLRTPVLGKIWVKYQVAQLARVLSTLLVGGIPPVQALETAVQSLDSALLKKAIDKARQMVREGQPLSASLAATGIFPDLSVDMIEVGESTGALPNML